MRLSTTVLILCFSAEILYIQMRITKKNYKLGCL